MKKEIIVCVIVACTGILSCDDLLKEEPKDQIFETNYFANENDAISAVNSIYAQLNATSAPPTFGGVYHSTYWVVQGLASDEMRNRQAGTPQNDQIDNFNFDPSNANFFDMWSTTYRAINNANFALGGIPDAPIDEGVKARLIGEASFLRAMLYFDLVRMFGDVPLVLEEDDGLSPERTPQAAVYQQIVDDLTAAINGLPESYETGNGLGRATQGAAYGLMAKVQLRRGEWQAAIDNAQAVIDLDNYALWPDFADAFRIANENGQETLFGVGFGDAGGAITFWEVGQFNVRLLPAELSAEVPGINAQGWQVATEDLVDAFDTDDRRRAVTFITEVDGTPLGDPHIRKYWDDVAEPNGGNTEADFPYMRYSEVLLIYAEALNELNNGPTTAAYDAINEVRERARFDGTTVQPILPDLTGLSYDAFKEAILLERRREFVAEGKRWFDLVRMDELQEKVPLAKPGVVPGPEHDLFPVPQAEIDLNQNLLPQNQGY